MLAITNLFRKEGIRDTLYRMFLMRDTELLWKKQGQMP